MTDDMTRLRWPLMAVLVGLLLAMLLAPAALAQTTATTQLGVPLTPSSTTEATGTTGSTKAAPAGSLISPKAADFKELNPGLTFPEASVQFLPEYDTRDAEVLVIINYQLPKGVKLPLDYQFRIPHNARLTGYALLDSQGNFDYKRPTPKVTPGTEWDLVDAQVPRDQPVHIEYYYKPGIKLDGARSFVVAYEAPAALDTLAVAVQQPARATDFTLTPPFGQSSPDAEGLTVFTSTATKVTAGEQARVQVSYSKPDANPTKSGASDTPGTQASQNYLVWLLIAMVVGVVGFVGYRVVSTRQAPAKAGAGRAGGGASRPRSTKVGSTAGKGKAAASGAGPQRFCTNCGAKLTKNDRFCPQCGQERE